jgi:hypothetical protein
MRIAKAFLLVASMNFEVYSFWKDDNRIGHLSLNYIVRLFHCCSLFGPKGVLQAHHELVRQFCMPNKRRSGDLKFMLLLWKRDATKARYENKHCDTLPTWRSSNPTKLLNPQFLKARYILEEERRKERHNQVVIYARTGFKHRAVFDKLQGSLAHLQTLHRLLIFQGL